MRFNPARTEFPCIRSGAGSGKISRILKNIIISCNNYPVQEKCTLYSSTEKNKKRTAETHKSECKIIWLRFSKIGCLNLFSFLQLAIIILILQQF